MTSARARIHHGSAPHPPLRRCLTIWHRMAHRPPWGKYGQEEVIDPLRRFQQAHPFGLLTRGPGHPNRMNVTISRAGSPAEMTITISAAASPPSRIPTGRTLTVLENARRARGATLGARQCRCGCGQYSAAPHMAPLYQTGPRILDEHVQTHPRPARSSASHPPSHSHCGENASLALKERYHPVRATRPMTSPTMTSTRLTPLAIPVLEQVCMGTSRKAAPLLCRDSLQPLPGRPPPPRQSPLDN